MTEVNPKRMSRKELTELYLQINEEVIALRLIVEKLEEKVKIEYGEAEQVKHVDTGYTVTTKRPRPTVSLKRVVGLILDHLDFEIIHQKESWKLDVK